MDFDHLKDEPLVLGCPGSKTKRLTMSSRRRPSPRERHHAVQFQQAAPELMRLMAAVWRSMVRKGNSVFDHQPPIKSAKQTLQLADSGARSTRCAGRIALLVCVLLRYLSYVSN